VRREAARSLGAFVALFRQDAARWVRPQQVASLDEVTARRMFSLLLRHPPLRAMAWFRFGSWAKAVSVVGLPGWCQRRIARLYGLEISPGDDIGGGLYVPHPTGTTISIERLGRNVSVIAAATVGARTAAVWPRIGDRVFVGAGARVLGGIDVGDDASIGANAVVIDDVPAGATVVGIPARVSRTHTP
jgi:serine O-acetyltransferase